MSILSKNIKLLRSYEKNIKGALASYVEVGIIGDKVQGNLYNGTPIVEIAAQHEFGSNEHNVPQRSFIRHSVNVKSNELKSFINKKLDVKKSLKREKRLELIGIFATNIIKKSFTTKGYGSWQPLKDETIKGKGSSQILIENGNLRRAVTWNVA